MPQTPSLAIPLFLRVCLFLLLKLVRSAPQAGTRTPRKS